MKWLKVGAVVFVSVVVTSLAIDAADTLDGVGGTLLGQLAGTQSGCPDGMIAVSYAQSFSCVDQYEAAVGEQCPQTAPRNSADSQLNVDDPSCQAVSRADALPWRFVTREQAALACMRAGKRLLTATEWFAIAAGTPDDGRCNVDSAGAKSGEQLPECVSAAGVFNAVGNVWEWTSDDVIEGTYQGRTVPTKGYVAQVAVDGFPTITNEQPSPLFGQDYFWSASEGAYGVLRGGFYGSESDAGVYSVHAQTEPVAASQAIGFRCVL